MKRLLISLVAIASLVSGVSRSFAEDYPTRPIRIILPFAAGGAVDIIARLLGEKMTAAWGQPVIVDAKPGGSGIVAANLVAKSPADGYTLLMMTANLTINPSLHKDLPYDTQRDLAPVAELVGIPDVIVVRADVPAHNLAELIALAKNKPGKLNYASPGVGTFPHLAFELFKKQAGVDIVHIPYKGAAPATMAMVAKQVDVMPSNISDVRAYIESGAMRALAVTSATRSKALPDVPTIAESGLSGFEAAGWMGLLAPAGTPKPVIDKLNRQIVDSVKADDLTKMLVGQGFDVMTGSPEDFAAFIARDLPRWAEAVKTSGATVN